MRGGGVGGGSSGGGGGVTLDGAYDFGGAGAGRAITADAGAVTISSTAADNNSLLSLTKNPAGAQSGAGLSVTMGANATGAAITISHAGSGNGIAANDGSGAAPAYAFANEPGLGFYRGGAGTVYLTSTAGNNSTFFGIAPRSSAPTGSTALAIYAEDNGGGVPTRGLILYAIPSNASSGAFFRPSTGYTVADGNLSGGLVVGTSGGANQPLYFGSDAIVMARVNSAQGNDLTVTLSADTKLGWTSTAAGSGMFGAITLDTQLKRDAAGIAGLYAAGSTYGSMRLAGLSLGGVVSVVSGQIRVASGNGGINHLLGPTDQTLSIISGVAANGAGQSLDLLGAVATAASANSGGYVNILAGAGDGAAAGGGATVTGGAGGATGTGGPVTITGGGAAGAAGGLVSIIGGSVQAGATDKNAGGVVVSTGASTGTGTSLIDLKVAPVANATGTLQNVPATLLSLQGASPNDTVYRGWLNVYGQIRFADGGGGGYPNILGPTDAPLEIGSPENAGGNGQGAYLYAGGSQAGTGGTLTLYGGDSSGADDLDAGNVSIQTGGSTGAGNSSITFMVAPVSGSGSGFNSTQTVVTFYGASGGGAVTLDIVNAGLRINGQTTGAGASAGTLTNAPSAGDPSFWLPINVGGNVRYIPCWT